VSAREERLRRDAFGRLRRVEHWQSEDPAFASLVDAMLGPGRCASCGNDHMHEVRLEHVLHGTDVTAAQVVAGREALRDGHRLDEPLWFCCRCDAIALVGIDR
jgi:hypothetical protein